jgi:hypothetical protein
VGGESDEDAITTYSQYYIEEITIFILLALPKKNPKPCHRERGNEMLSLQ